MAPSPLESAFPVHQRAEHGQATMTASPATTHDEAASTDAVENVTHYIPWVIPVGGAILIFLLAFIAVMMA